jgi:hypothetical protein
VAGAVVVVAGAVVVVAGAVVVVAGAVVVVAGPVVVAGAVVVVAGAVVVVAGAVVVVGETERRLAESGASPQAEALNSKQTRTDKIFIIHIGIRLEQAAATKFGRTAPSLIEVRAIGSLPWWP